MVWDMARTTVPSWRMRRGGRLPTVSAMEEADSEEGPSRNSITMSFVYHLCVSFANLENVEVVWGQDAGKAALSGSRSISVEPRDGNASFSKEVSTVIVTREELRGDAREGGKRGPCELKSAIFCASLWNGFA